MEASFWTARKRPCPDGKAAAPRAWPCCSRRGSRPVRRSSSRAGPRRCRGRAARPAPKACRARPHPAAAPCRAAHRQRQPAWHRLHAGIGHRGAAGARRCLARGGRPCARLCARRHRGGGRCRDRVGQRAAQPRLRARAHAAAPGGGLRRARPAMGPACGGFGSVLVAILLLHAKDLAGGRGPGLASWTMQGTTHLWNGVTATGPASLRED